MANKKVKIPAYVLKQFEKAMYKVGDEVIIRWLGQKKIGYVTKYKKSNFGISYTVEVTEMGFNKQMRSARYPCGIKIKEYSTSYNVGVILHDETRDYYKSKPVNEYTGSSKAKVKTNSGSNRVNSSSNNRKTSGSRNTTTTKTNTKSSSKRVHANNSKTRKLDTAIDRQKDFLNGFIKK